MKENLHTIRSAIIHVFNSENRPLFPEEIYQLIVSRQLYTFNTDSPLHVVKTRLRRDCIGLDFSASSKDKYFQFLSDGSYWLKDKKIPKGSAQQPFSAHSGLNNTLELAYEDYLRNFREGVLGTLKRLSPQDFEAFCRSFVAEYGFTETTITPATRDGGIDGFGKLRIGFTTLDVAFECKRWSDKEIDYKIIRQFRGSVPTSCVYGILFTTSTFSRSAKNEAERDDRKPIVLIDGNDIVDFMIKNEFGVAREKQLVAYVNQIDLAILEK